jgi:hypothetical protein
MSTILSPSAASEPEVDGNRPPNCHSVAAQAGMTDEADEGVDAVLEQVLNGLPVAAAAFAVPQFLPQLAGVKRSGDTSGVSWSWAALTSVNNGGWIVYFALSAAAAACHGAPPRWSPPGPQCSLLPGPSPDAAGSGRR